LILQDGWWFKLIPWEAGKDYSQVPSLIVIRNHWGSMPDLLITISMTTIKVEAIVIARVFIYHECDNNLSWSRRPLVFTTKLRLIFILKMAQPCISTSFISVTVPVYRTSMTLCDHVNDMKAEELWQNCLIIYKTIDPL